MRNRRGLKLKKRRLLSCAFVIMMLFLGTAYSALKQDVSLDGKVIIPGKDDWEDVLRYNLDAEITTTQGPWEEGGVIKATINFKVTNNNDFDVNNWYAKLYVPGIISATSYNLHDYEVDTENEIITFSNVEGNWTSSIKAGASKEGDIVVILKVADISKVNIIAYSLYDNLKLQDFEYIKDDLKFEVAYTEESDYNGTGKYAYTAVIKVTNNSDKVVKNINYEMKYKEPVPGFNFITVEGEMQAMQKTTNMLGLSSLSWVNVQPGGTSTTTVRNIITDYRKFRGFTFENITYTKE